MENITIEEIIRRISFVRNRAGLSARELSLRIGKNPSYISRLEYKKDFNPSIKTLKEILDACNVSFQEFFYYDISQYQNDKELFQLLGKINKNKKESILNLLQN